MFSYGQHCQANVEGVQSAPVKAPDGWKNVDIRFMITGENCGEESICWWRTIFPPGATHEPHYHLNAEAVFYILRGRGMTGHGDREYEVGPGTAIFVPKGSVHWFRNLDPEQEVELLGCYAPADGLEGAGYVPVGDLEHVLGSETEPSRSLDPSR